MKEFGSGPRSGGNGGGFRGGGGGGRGPGGRSGGGFKRNFNSGPREMHKATCSECGKECEVPFKPAQDKPVFCQDCYKKKKGFS
ncbi:DNA-directed RNA polymerase [Candidatus Pacearchaeota archaeon CG10_big_fil_rev_8_21_14_0_10_32_14]|nr:MAG: DNA-directed RNA polymerase [Candidatus Pacearchaeota archaeon CG10_big_fil_rev_8_21_14_0_10_32_14]